MGQYSHDVRLRHHVVSANRARFPGPGLCHNISMDAFQRALAEVVGGIEREMKRIDLWESERPALSRLGSGQPFCFDTLRFHQWLQWLFLPRMRRILASGGAGMPERSAIHPYADECLRDRAEETDELLFLIRTFDELITARAEAADEEAH